MPKLPLTSAKFQHSAVLIFVLAVVLMAFWPTLQGDFVFWDDDVHLFKNVSVQTLDYEHLRDIFTSKVNQIYIPLTSLTFAIEHHFFGNNPFVYRLNNLFLHMGIVAFAYWLGLRLGLSILASGIAALIFGIHPMHVESVAWITERKDVLYGIFYMAALVSYTYYLNFTDESSLVKSKRKMRYLIGATVCAILSMLAKPMALSLPLILLLMDWFHERPIKKEAIAEKIPLSAAIAGIMMVTYVSHARVPGNNPIEGILVWCWTLIFYLKQFLLPIGLVPIYQLPRPILPYNPEYIFALLATALLIFSVYRLRKNAWFMFAVAFYFFSIFFLLRFDDAKDANIVADRFMYLPSLGFCFLFGYGWDRMLNVKRRNMAALSAFGLVVVLCILALGTHKQVKIWDNSISLWKHQLRHYPNEVISLNNFAASLREQKEFKEAEKVYRQLRPVLENDPEFKISNEARKQVDMVKYVLGLYQRAISIDRNSIESYNHLGNMLKDLKFFPEAIKAYKETLKVDHKNKDAHFSLGELYQKIGDYKQAVYAYNQTIKYNLGNEDIYVAILSAYNEEIERNPQNAVYAQARKRTMEEFTEIIRKKPPRATSFFNLGFLYSGMNQYDLAAAAYQMALDINPRHSKALYNLGNVYRDTGNLTEALNTYERALSANPRYSDVYLNMGSIYERQGKRKLAREFFTKAVKVAPQNARALFNMAVIEEASGNLKKAAKMYEKSLNLDPANKKSYYNLGNTYARLGNNQKAIDMYKKSLEIDENFRDAWINLSTISFKEGKYKDAVKYCDEAILLGYIAPKGYLKALAPYR